MRKKQEEATASQAEMEDAVEKMVKTLEYVESQMSVLKEEKKLAIDTCVSAGVPKPVVAELIRRLNMDQDVKNIIDVYVPILENFLDGKTQ